jgi:hypothetical protein
MCFGSERMAAICEGVGGYLKANHAPPTWERLALIATCSDSLAPTLPDGIAPFNAYMRTQVRCAALKPSAAAPAPAKGRAASACRQLEGLVAGS